MTERPLQILICTANMGNAKPTPSTIAAWIPFDGNLHATKKSKYPIDELSESYFKEDAEFPFGRRDPKRHIVPKEAEWFDIIVIGMQEATFFEKEKDEKGHENESIDKRRLLTTSANLSTFNILTAVDADNNKMVKETLKSLGNPLETGKVIRRGMGGLGLDKVSQATDKIVTPLHTIAADKDHAKKGVLLDHPATTFGGTKILQNMIMKRCPSYECPVHYQRGEMRLLILVRKDIVHLLDDIDCRAGNTGVGSFLPNKGGIKVTLTICKTRLSFVTAHLAAHEGKEYYANRCSNITNIFDQTRGEKYPHRHDCTISSHHTFVFGDLNFRVALPDREETGHEKHVEKVIKLISKSDWKTLNANDELIHAVKKGDCMYDFKTLPCHFPPTFKVKREEGFIYNPQRSPSYTDRILWKSTPGLKADVKPLLYEPCVSFNTSDHKAIRGAFSVIPRGSIASRYSRNKASPVSYLFEDKNELHPRYQVDIFVSDISCSFLDSEQSTQVQNVKSYAISMIDPIDLIQGRKGVVDKFQRCPKTNVRKGTFDPDWGDEELQMRLNPKCFDLLHGSFLYVMLVQDITGWEDSVHGTVALDLQLLFTIQRDHLIEDRFSCVEIENAAITKNGIVQGHLNCVIAIFFNRKDEELSLSKRRSTIKKSKKISWKKIKNVVKLV